MYKELKFLFYLLTIFLFIFLSIKHYISDNYKKQSYRMINNNDEKIMLYSKKLKTLKNDTDNVIKYIDNNKITEKKKYFFMDLLKKND